ncbi:MAG TPA: MATE family efflux transporter [bacterium]
MSATELAAPRPLADGPAATPTPAPAATSDLAERRAMILNGATVPTLLKLGLPTLLVLVVQSLVNMLEAWYVGFLGTDALAGVALVFPVFMLMQTISNGGFGGGVAAAVARASGSGRRADADALVFHSLAIAVTLGALFMVAGVLGGPLLYRAMGGTGAALAAALTYSIWIFAASIPLWTVALLASTLRGAGNVKVPALVTIGGFVVLVPLSPALIFGFGPFPRMGVAGGGIAIAAYFTAAALVLIGYLTRPGATVRLRWVPMEWRHFKAILGVGTVSSLNSIQFNITIALVTAAVGSSTAAAIAGFGIATRLDYLLIPLLFGFGSAAITMVATHLGAGDPQRAKRIAWTAAAMAFTVTECIGLAAALFAPEWAGLFSHDPAVVATATDYLRRVAPFYGFFGVGLTLYFSAQGANRVGWLILPGFARMVLAGGLGWYAVVALGMNLTTLFWITAAAYFTFGGSASLVTYVLRWGVKR